MEVCHVGIDWGRREHQIEIALPSGERIISRHEASVQGHARLCEMLKEAVASEELVHVGIESPSEPIVDALMNAGFRVFHINPKKIDRLREAHRMAACKNDVLRCARHR